MTEPVIRQNLGVRLLAYAIIIGGAWLLWRPLGAVVLVVSFGNLRSIVQLNSLFWEKPFYAAVFGSFVGIAAAGLTQLASRVAFSSVSGALGITCLGLLAMAYIGYGLPRDPLFQERSHQLVILTEGAAAIAYLITSGLVLGWAFTHGWY